MRLCWCSSDCVERLGGLGCRGEESLCSRCHFSFRQFSFKKKKKLHTWNHEKTRWHHFLVDCMFPPEGELTTGLKHKGRKRVKIYLQLSAKCSSCSLNTDLEGASLSRGMRRCNRRSKRRCWKRTRRWEKEGKKEEEVMEEENEEEGIERGGRGGGGGGGVGGGRAGGGGGAAGGGGGRLLFNLSK